jgi:hypothetical protein
MRFLSFLKPVVQRSSSSRSLNSLDEEIPFIYQERVSRFDQRAHDERHVRIFEA